MNDKTNHLTTTLGWLICGLGAAFYCYEYLLRIAPGTMMNELMTSFSLDATGFGALVSLYYLAYTPLQAIVGVVHDVYGPRRVLVFAVLVCVIGNLLFSTTHSIAIASIARFLIGFGSAFAFVGVLKLATIWLPPTQFAMIAGLTTSLGMVGGLFGNIWLMAFVQKIGWRETLYASTFIGVVLAPIMWFFIRDRSTNNQNPIEKMGYRETLINLLKVIKNPQLWIVGFIGSMLYSSLSIFAEVYGNQTIMHISNSTPQTGADLNSMIFFGWLLGGPLFGLFSDKIRRRRLPLVIGCVMSLILFVIAIYVPNLSVKTLSALLFLFGFFSSAEVICFAVGREISNPKLAGTSVAFVNMIVMLAGMVFQPVVGKLLDLSQGNTVTAGSPIYTAHEFRMALILIPIGLAFSLLATLGLRETHAKVL